MGVEALEAKLKLAAEAPIAIPYRLTQLVGDKAEQLGGNMPGPVLMVSISRPSATSELSDLVDLAKQYDESGADALCVPMDSDDSPSGLKDVFCISREVKIPVVAQDWFIHPLQLVEARDAGACGILGVVASVSGKGTPVLSSFAAALGLDCPVEVVNGQQAEAMAQMGVAAFAVNTSVGLNLSITGVSSAIAEGVLQQLPFGSLSIVGARSMDEARHASQAGADIVLLKDEVTARWQDTPKSLIDEARYATSGDD